MMNIFKYIVTITFLIFLKLGAANASTNSIDVNNDGSQLLDLPFSINIDNTSYDSIFVNENGTASFGRALSSYSASGLAYINTPVISIFMSDIHTDINGSVLYEVVSDAHYRISWVDVGFYAFGDQLLNSFEINIKSRAEIRKGDVDIELQFLDVNWLSSDNLGGTNGFGGSFPKMGVFSSKQQVEIPFPKNTDESLVISDLLASSEGSNTAGLYKIKLRNGIAYRGNATVDSDEDGIEDSGDNCPETANIDQADVDKDGIGNVCDLDNDNDGLPDTVENSLGLNPLNADSDGNGVNDGDEDSDQDGMPNRWEVEHDLDPGDASDADQDRDNNGESNLDEYLRVLDSQVPVVTAPADIITASTGYKTFVNLGAASANDATQGTLIPVHNAGKQHFRPGGHIIIWSATNQQGNTSTDTQQVDILPRVDLESDRDVREGQALTISVQLNGDAPSYPVTIPIVTSGTATLDEDYSLSASEIVITSGHTGTLDITTKTDAVAEGEETLILTLGTLPSNAAKGGRDSMMIKIKEVNSPPRLRLKVEQDNQKSQILRLTGGIATIKAVTQDPDGDTLSYLWHSDTLVDLDSDNQVATFEFDPNQVGEGKHKVSLTINDGNGEETQKTIKLRIKDETGQKEELFIDTNENGIPDLYDSFTASHLLSSNGGTESPMETEPGLYLTTGDIGLDQESYQGRVSKAQIASYLTNNGLGAYLEDNEHDLTDDIYDYKIKDLAIKGQSISIVFTLSTPIAVNAKLRKYNETNGWTDFVVDANNSYQTWNSIADNCTFPDTDTITVTVGLKEGANCLQITIEDGGENDEDGEANGEIDDPVAIATVKSSSGGSSGSSSSDTTDTTNDSSSDDTDTDTDSTEDNGNTEDDDNNDDNTDMTNDTRGGVFELWLMLLFAFLLLIRIFDGISFRNSMR